MPKVPTLRFVGVLGAALEPPIQYPSFCQDSSASSESETETSMPTMNTEPEETEHMTRRSKDEEFIRNYVSSLSKRRLEAMSFELLRRQPDFLVDIMEREAEESEEQSKGPGEISPWCKCQRCRPMPTAVENKCCGKRGGRCVTLLEAFNDICLNANVLGLSMAIREDELAEERNRSHANYRHYAYRGFVYWQFGRLGKGDRIVLPSCCVVRIRQRCYTIEGENVCLSVQRFQLLQLPVDFSEICCAGVILGWQYIFFLVT